MDMSLERALNDAIELTKRFRILNENAQDDIRQCVSGPVLSEYLEANEEVLEKVDLIQQELYGLYSDLQVFYAQLGM